MEALKKLLCLCVLFWGVKGWTQQCPEPVSPGPGDLVSPDVPIIWTEVEGVPAYLIQLGTTEGGDEILPLTSRGPSTTYIPPLGLPENETIYAELWVFNLLTNLPFRCVRYTFQTTSYTSPPECTEMVRPFDGEENVPVQSAISWSYSPRATEYVVSLSTSDGEFLNVEVADLSLDPSEYLPDGLPPEEEIFVQITPKNSLDETPDCAPFSFITGPVATLPDCSPIIYPVDGQFEVPLSPIIRWDSVPGANGYYVTLADSPLDGGPINNLILDRNPFDATLVRLSEVRPLEPNLEYFLQVIPFNEAGEALGCEPISFYTILGCGPYFDEEGTLIDFSPELNFPERVEICGDEDSILTATDPADGYFWYVFENQTWKEIERGPVFTAPRPGEYRLEIYDEFLDPSGIPIKCSSYQDFSVIQSEPAIIEDTDVDLGTGVISIEVTVSGIGDYEFALNDPGGPYQDSNRFTGLPLDNYRVFVRDRNGCGITEVLVEPDLTLEGFPKFFTPNGDGINDFWQFILPPSGVNPIRELIIFDRFGNFLAQVDPQSAGWDGTFNGRPVPASDYWFRAINNNNQEIRGHFSLKR